MHRSIERFRRIPIRMLAVLLLLESILFVVGTVWYTTPTLLREDLLSDSFNIPDDAELNDLAPADVQALEEVLLLLFVPLAIPAFLAAFGFVLLWNSGWVLAMLTQVSALALALMLYAFYAPVSIVPIPWLLFVYMGVGIFMVLFLNISDVRVAFRRKTRTEGTAA